MPDLDVRLRDATEADLPRILEITNDAIVHTTAIWSLDPTTLAERQGWFSARRERGYPVLVATDAEGRALGFASYGEFRPRAGYRHTVEHSLYVDAALRGRELTTIVAKVEAIGPSGYVTDLALLENRFEFQKWLRQH